MSLLPAVVPQGVLISPWRLETSRQAHLALLYTCLGQFLGVASRGRCEPSRGGKLVQETTGPISDKASVQQRSEPGGGFRVWENPSGPFVQAGFADLSYQV